MSDFYENQSNVEQYIKMMETYDNSFIINALASYLCDGNTLLELGSGTGKDFQKLSKRYQVTASDYSSVFVSYLKHHFDNEKIIQLDARMMDVNQVYDCIYSNKVLQHLSKEELRESVKQQVKHLKSGGLVFHSFWYGSHEAYYEGLRFVYYNEEALRQVFSPYVTIIGIERYTESEADDSVYIVGRVQ